jgi:hypothetical protein
MSRNLYNEFFRRLSQEVLPPGIDLLCINGVWLHPLIKLDGGFDNAKTVFGLTVPSANGRSLYAQVSDAAEKALFENSSKTANLLKTDLRAAAGLWETHAVDHLHALEKMVKL